MTAIALTIAGSDSGGGAGIQADLKAFSAMKAYGASVITAITAQNTMGVTAIHDVPIDIISAQIEAVLSDLDVDAIKIGMLSNPETIQAVAEGIAKYPKIPVILDPVMVAESGDVLLQHSAISALIELLFPKAALITPNLPEAAKLLDCAMAENRSDMEVQAQKLLALGANAVLMKGGHFEGDAADYFCDGQKGEWFEAERIESNNTHGTGCSLSSAIAAGIAHGKDLSSATEAAKAWLTGAIAAADSQAIGKGHGPVHHFHDLW
jgi:hydroxymethylpyrimidine/phosphomethylpyrimidine kinase